MSTDHARAKGGDTAKTSFSSETFLTETETAQLLNLSQRTLQRWRQEGHGLPFCRFGGLIRYARSDIERWIAEQRRISTSELVP